MAQDAGDEIFSDGFEVLVTLTVDDYLGWCTVAVGSLAPSASQTLSLTERLGSIVNVDAQPNVGFIWGYWTGTDGDTSAAHDRNESTMVTMTADKTVLACCPFAAEPMCP